MTTSSLISMAFFALASSLSPGPVTLMCLSSGTRYNIAVGCIFVTGATLGFTLLFVLTGLGLQTLLTYLPWFLSFLKGAGILFLLYLSYQLFTHDGHLTRNKTSSPPGFWTGVMMQWINPKAWFASLAAVATYTSSSTGYDINLLFIFASVYFPICWLSLSSWLIAGNVLGRWLASPVKIRRFNQSLASGLILSCIVILLVDSPS